MTVAVPLKFHIARVVLAFFLLLCLVAIGAGIHDYSETLDSLNHWKVALKEDPNGSKTRPGGQSPASRVRRLEERLGKIPESFIAPVICMVLFGGLLYLSSVKVRETLMKVPNREAGLQKTE